MALRHTISLSPPGASDVGQRKFHLVVDGGPETVTVLDPTATEHVIDLARNASVAIWLTDVDTSGNESLPSPTLTFTALDTFPPPAPGELAVTNVEEIPD